MIAVRGTQKSLFGFKQQAENVAHIVSYRQYSIVWYRQCKQGGNVQTICGLLALDIFNSFEANVPDEAEFIRKEKGQSDDADCSL